MIFPTALISVAFFQLAPSPLQIAAAADQLLGTTTDFQGTFQISAKLPSGRLTSNAVIYLETPTKFDISYPELSEARPLSTIWRADGKRLRIYFGSAKGQKTAKYYPLKSPPAPPTDLLARWPRQFPDFVLGAATYKRPLISQYIQQAMLDKGTSVTSAAQRVSAGRDIQTLYVVTVTRSDSQVVMTFDANVGLPVHIESVVKRGVTPIVQVKWSAAFDHKKGAGKVPPPTKSKAKPTPKPKKRKGH